MDKKDIPAKYGRSEQGNFGCVDTIGVPHPYCIGTKHVVHASDHFSGRLGEEAIRDAEKHGAHCGMKGCLLPYDKHEQALLVECKADMKDAEGKACPELHAYLLKIKDQATADSFAGFAFLDRREKVQEQSHQ